LLHVEKQCAGTLLNNCGEALWRQRYYTATAEEKASAKYPWTGKELLHMPLSRCVADRERHVSQWMVRFHMGSHAGNLFGCTEDILCDRDRTAHAQDYDAAPHYCRSLCKHCRMPVCEDCWAKLWEHNGTLPWKAGGTIPMSLANDHYYGHVHRVITKYDVTWLEMAACSTIWTTMLVYYLEMPYGHLLNAKIGKPVARTAVRGNLYSYPLAMEDMNRSIAEALQYAARAQEPAAAKLARSCHGLPHSEETLALLVHVQIIGGSKDLAKHIKGVTLRLHVLEELLEVMRNTGYPGYGPGDVNSAELVAQRLQARYKDPYASYGRSAFVPKAVLAAVQITEPQSQSLVQDKAATPADAPSVAEDAGAAVEECLKQKQPLHHMAERSSEMQGRAHLDCLHTLKSNFETCGTLDIKSGSDFVNQFVPWYLGMAFPMTLPAAVGGYDVHHEKRWRRPEDRREGGHGLIDWLRRNRHGVSGAGSVDAQVEEHSRIGDACRVKLYDFVKGLSQRIEGQFRRDWSFVPGLWNMYFRECLLSGHSLSVGTKVEAASPTASKPQEYAIALQELYDLLTNGKYMAPGGRKMSIRGDVSKLWRAIGISKPAKKILGDLQFRTRKIPGTAEIRKKIGRVGKWACVNYGHAIFLTMSPSERHNYLACRLSRYRQEDPYAASSQTQAWCGAEVPSLEPSAEDEFEVHIPGFDTRRLLMAADPLAAVNAFFIQVRTVLATMLGIRMCPLCPHCNSDTDRPCQDACGSNAEAMGGIAGRVDAMFGAVEAQKSTGTLHFHCFIFVQRVHQFSTLKEIAMKLQEGLLQAEDLKHYHSQICTESYPDLQHFVDNAEYLEQHCPTYSEMSECKGPVKRWDAQKLGRVPEFVHKKPALDAVAYAEEYGQSLQFFMERSQHHWHRLQYNEKEKNGSVSYRTVAWVHILGSVANTTSPKPSACGASQTRNRYLSAKGLRRSSN